MSKRVPRESDKYMEKQTDKREFWQKFIVY